MDALRRLLHMSRAERRRRGLEYTPREIAQQPRTWRQTGQYMAARRRILAAFLRRAGLADPGECAAGFAVLLLGAGSSDYIGQALAARLERGWQCPVQARASTDQLLAAAEDAGAARRRLWISFSRSGDSPEAVAVVERALVRQPEIHHLLITCNPAGRLARNFQRRPNVCALVLDPKVNDRGLAMTSSFTNLLLAGTYLADLPAGKGQFSLINLLADAAESELPAAAELAAAAMALRPSRVCVLGDGPLQAVARESALKITELTAGKILAWEQTFLGLRHGPMAALNARTLLVAFLSSDAHCRRYERDVLAELRAKKLAQKLFVWGAAAEEIPGARWCGGQSARAYADELRPPLDVILGQLLGLFGALAMGIRPDSPSAGGVIHRVVSHFPIYES